MPVTNIPTAGIVRKAIEIGGRHKLEEVFGSDVERLLAGGEQLAIFYRDFLENLLSGFDVSSAPIQYRSKLLDISRKLAYYGLYASCLLYDYPNRVTLSANNREEVKSDWLIKTLTANSYMNAADKLNMNWPSGIFTIFYSEVPAIEKSIGLGWWRRLQNKNKFRALFASGFLLGMMHDKMTQAL